MSAVFFVSGPLDEARSEAHAKERSLWSSMSRLSKREPDIRPSGGERVFADAAGQLWSAAPLEADANGATVVFTCISDGRQSGRALVVGSAEEVRDVGEETLRAWLEAAPRIGRLT